MGNNPLVLRVKRDEKEIEAERKEKEAREARAEKELLLMEYQQLCEDWRQRDRYLIEKLIAAGILFGLLGVAFKDTPNWLVQLALMAIGGFFAFICMMSTINDLKYRDGTEQLIRAISDKLELHVLFNKLGDLKNNIKPLENKTPVDPEKATIKNPLIFQFLRKVAVDPKKSTIKNPPWLINGLREQPTFRYIFWFYVFSMVCFIVFFITILVGHWVHF